MQIMRPDDFPGAIIVVDGEHYLGVTGSTVAMANGLDLVQQRLRGKDPKYKPEVRDITARKRSVLKLGQGMTVWAITSGQNTGYFVKWGGHIGLGWSAATAVLRAKLNQTTGRTCHGDADIVERLMTCHRISALNPG